MSQLFQKMLIPFFILGCSTYYFIEMLGKDEQASYLIKPVYYIIVILFIVNFFMDLRHWRKEQLTLSDDPEKKESFTKELKAIKKTAFYVITIAVYLMIMPFLGFIISTILFLYLSFGYLGGQNKFVSFVSAVGLAIILYLLFKIVLGVPLFDIFSVFKGAWK